MDCILPAAVTRSRVARSAALVVPGTPKDRGAALARRGFYAVRRAALGTCERRMRRVLLAGLGAGVVLWCCHLSLLALVVLFATIGLFGFNVVAVVLSRTYAWRLHGPPGPALEPEVLPVDIEPTGLRSSYREILRVHERIRVFLRDHEGARAGHQTLYRSCGELVEMAGRMAMLGNGLEQHLDSYKVEDLQGEIERLEARVRAATDVEARRTYAAAALAKRRQLETHHALHGLQDRVCARLDVVTASLEDVYALLVKLNVLEVEQEVLSGECVGDQLDALRDDLRLVEAAMIEAVGCA
jgi:hypothetical protein